MFFKESINTLNASWLKLKLVKLFGKTEYVENGRSLIVIKHFRGKSYLINYATKKTD